MDFDEYLNLQSQKFVQYYRCLPISVLNKENVDEDGNRIIMPPSALDRLYGFNNRPDRFAVAQSALGQSPMMFQIQNPITESATHCSVLEFVADEGFIYVPSRLMAQLGVQENELVLVQAASLPRATFVKLRPHTSDFLDVSHPKELLEHNFRKFPCLTAGETIAVTDDGRRYYLDVVEAQPANAVCAVDTDCGVDFATPLDYVEPPKPVVASQTGGERQQKPQFTGVAARMDGKKVEMPPPAPVPVGRPGGQPRQPAVFTGVAVRLDGKPVEPLPPPAPSPAAARAGAPGAPKRKNRLDAPSAAGSGVSKEQEKRFTGTRYSLKD